MPSSIGHLLAGTAAAWTADLLPGRRDGRFAPPQASWWVRAGDGLTVVCTLLAVVPDIDLVLRIHRTFTHSLSAAIVVGLGAAAIAIKAKRPVARVALMCSGAYATHLLLDWLAADRFPPYGIQLLWPFSERWYISGWNLFGTTERRHFLTAAVIGENLRTVAKEIAILGPLLVGLWLVRIKALSGFGAKLPGGDHSPE